MDEHAELLAKAAWVLLETCGSSGASCETRPARFSLEHGSRRFSRSGKKPVRPDNEQRRQELLWDVEGLARLNLQVAWCQYGMDGQAKAARDAAWQAKQRWTEGHADSMARLQETGDWGSDWAATWSAMRKLVGRKKRSFRPPVPMLGDDGKPFASLQAKAKQHQRELTKEFGENCAEFSEAEHLLRVQADKQAAPVLFTRSPMDTCALPGTGGCSSRSLQAQVRSCFWARRYSLELIAAGGQGYRRALGALCAKVLKDPMLWKGGDMATVPRKPGPLTPSNTRGVLCSTCPGKMKARVLRAAAVPWLPMSAGLSQTGAVRGGGTEFAIKTRSLLSSWAQLRKLSSAVINVDIRKAFYSVLVEEVVGPVMGRSDGAKVMARLGWTESERHRLEATLQGRQHETALLEIAPDVAAMMADWQQTNRFTVQGAEKRALHFTGVRSGDPTADVMFAFAFARFHRKLVDRLRKKGLRSTWSLLRT